MVWWGSGSSGALLIPPEAWCIVCLGKVNSISDVKAGFYSCVLEHAAHKIHVTVVDLIFGVHPKTRDANTSAEKCAHHIMGCADGWSEIPSSTPLTKSLAGYVEVKSLGYGLYPE